jgi:dihydroflavonol-4-reductase
MEKINVEGTRLVCRACVKAGVGRLVHTSSVVAVGASREKKYLNEDSPFELEAYDFGYYETKRRAEAVVREFVAREKLDAVMVNPSVMFGAGDAVKGSRKTHLKVAAGRFPFYPSGGVNIMHVADAVNGHIKALEKGRTGERYLLGGDNVLIRELFVMLAEAGGVKPPRVALPNFILRGAFRVTKTAARLGVKNMPPTDSALIATLFHWYDTSKARRELDLKARPGREAIFESVAWARANGYLPMASTLAR